MRNLLSAGFARLKKSKIFGIILFVMILFQCLSIFTNYSDMKHFPEYTCSLDELFFYYTIYLGIAIAVFCSLFLGTEYSDGTIRNKLMVGHTRHSIYFSNLILCSVAGIIICIAGMLPSFCAGIPLFGFFKMSPAAVISMILCSLAIAVTYTSLFTLAAMLIHSKAVIAVVAILSATLLLVAASRIQSSLGQPEIWEGYTFTMDNGDETTIETQPNPFYIRGAKREFYEFLLDFLPSGQTVRIMSETVSLSRTMFYDAVILLFTTGAGILCFQRKDIK